MRNEAIYESELDGGFKVHVYHRVVDPFVRPARFHCHPEYELGAVLSGRGTYLCGGKCLEIEPGDVFAFAADEPHYITSVEPGAALHLVNLHFTRGFLCGESGGEYLRAFDAHQNRFPAACVDELRAVENALLADGAFNLLRARALLELFLTSLALSLPDCSGAEVRKTSRAAERLSGAADYVDAHLTERLTLADIASAAGMSRGYVSSEFRKSYGVPLWDYITAKRVQRAIGLMHESDLSMLEIALASGFNNSASFNRAFRRFTAKTPTEYLREGTVRT